MTNPLYDRLIGDRRDSDAVLLHLPEGGTVTYAQMAARADRIAGMLRARGLAKGDRLAMQCPKSPEALALYLACLQSGVIFLPLNTAYTPDEIAYFVGDATPKILVTDPAAEAALTPVAQKAGAALLTLDGDQHGSFAQAVAASEPVTSATPCTTDDLTAFLYTSGTTGRSKGAMLTQGNLLSNAEVLTETWRFTAQDVLIHSLPIFHAHGLFVACNVLMLAGGSMIWLPGFTVAGVLAALPGATTMMGVPTFYTRLLDSPDFDRARAGHMRLFTSGSAPLLAETHTAFRARTGHAILERYGMTETGMNTSNPYDGERRAGTVGFPLKGTEIRIMGQEGQELPCGETGMIEVRGPNVFKGYWQMPEKTAEELRDNGFFITGDLGLIDADGYVTIVGREKDLIISGGYNIYPKEVEQVLDDQPGVKESAVIGVPHPDFGEGVVAVLVPETGTTPDLDAIAAAVAGKLANFKRPKAYFVLDSLPRNTMGKVQKNVLRAEYAEQFDTAPGVKKAGE
ncbi:malonyl-CoA synthase [Lutimaribacter sp. EGI FJ00015]|uniref:Malonyl-CoA synthase n=1 Tax=Lutimaribacter degradans TaxID=2945989 RepID=A0ACC5ZXY6_9RHOB|nr:malonyl-CoA synthase [Lutimaribacter sp. EGI FJ00013]MCM2562965.1 malonyl-CoA synthase [Lutimaribacter sp. EGI FJ00013]MCO0614133.1 malonyl-CoA synthase [Lutimaribacter sp. EGI FJ00015]MCO0636110.1 malonyl-CoA synthase [Lutimaribacter sp. EGI FJ00014]